MLNVLVRRLMLFGVLGSALPLFAQAPYLAKGNQEANVFGGVSYGLDLWRGSFGGNYAVAPFNKYIMLYGEYSYFPGVNRTFADVRNSRNELEIKGGNAAVKFNDFHGGVHIRLPIFPEKRIVPYVSGGAGILQAAGDVSLLGAVSATQFTPRNFSASSTGFALNGGGGLRLYLSGDGRFGARFEAKVYKPMSDLALTDYTGKPAAAAAFGKISVGFFYQFR